MPIRILPATVTTIRFIRRAWHTFKGQWKLFFDAELLRLREARPFELYDLNTDLEEKQDRLHDESLKPLVEQLTQLALLHRNSGGHLLAKIASEQRISFDWRSTAEQALRHEVSTT